MTRNTATFRSSALWSSSKEAPQVETEPAVPRNRSRPACDRAYHIRVKPDEPGSLFSQEMTHQEFMVAVENKTIESVDINQNQQPPTGILDILLKSGDRAVVAVSDVKEAENFSGKTLSTILSRMFHRRIT